MPPWWIEFSKVSFAWLKTDWNIEFVGPGLWFVDDLKPWFFDPEVWFFGPKTWLLSGVFKELGCCEVTDARQLW